MKKLILSLILILILPMGMSMALAQEPIEGGTIGPGTMGKTTPLGEANAESIDAASQYIKQKLGESYYDQLISFESGESYEFCIFDPEESCEVKSVITFLYKIPFDVSGSPESGPPPNKIYITVDGQEAVVDYRGPSKPYQFLISQEDAIAKAESYGIKDINKGAVIVQAPAATGYEIVWAVSSRDLSGVGPVLEEPIYRGVYIDVDTGEVRGEYRINPLIYAPDSGVKLGEFFQDQEISKEPQEQEKLDLFSTPVILIVFGIAIIFLIIFYLIINRYKR